MLLGEGRKIHQTTSIRVRVGAFLGIFLAGLTTSGTTLGQPTHGVNPSELTAGLEQSIPKVAEFAAIRRLGQKYGLRVFLFGGTASTFAHYTRWALEHTAGSTAFDPNLLDFHYSNIYRATQDLDLVVDGDLTKIDAFEDELGALFPYIQGSHKTKWEVRPLRVAAGDKEPLIGNPDFINQHSDSSSTGLIELTVPPPGEGLTHDLRADWTANAPIFLTDVAAGRIHYYYSPDHRTTGRARAGKNPEIFSVIRLLTKVVQFDLELSTEDTAAVRKVIEAFKPEAEVTAGYVAYWIEMNAKKLLLNAVDLERASNLLDELGLRQKLLQIPRDGPQSGARTDDDESLHWLLRRKPLPSFPIVPAKADESTAESLGLSEVAHETNSFEAFEAIMMSHSGLPNFFLSRDKHDGEAAVYGDGVYTKPGREGEGNSHFTIRMNLEPNAVLDRDFKLVGPSKQYVLILNRNAVKVIPQSLSITPSEWYARLSLDLFEESDVGLIQKVKARIDRDLLHLSPEEAKRTLEVFVTAFKREKIPAPLLDEWFRIRSLLPRVELPLRIEAKVVCGYIDTKVAYNEEAAESLVNFLETLPAGPIDQPLLNWAKNVTYSHFIPVLIRLTRGRTDLSLATWVELFSKYYQSLHFQTGQLSDLVELQTLFSERYPSLTSAEKVELKTALKQNVNYGKKYRSLDLLWAVPHLEDLFSPLELLKILGSVKEEKDDSEDWNKGPGLEAAFDAGVKHLSPAQKDKLMAWMKKRYADKETTQAMEWTWFKSEFAQSRAAEWTKDAVKLVPLDLSRILFLKAVGPSHELLRAVITQSNGPQFFEFLDNWRDFIAEGEARDPTLNPEQFEIFVQLLPTLVDRLEKLAARQKFPEHHVTNIFQLLRFARPGELTPTVERWINAAITHGDDDTLQTFLSALRFKYDGNVAFIPLMGPALDALDSREHEHQLIKLVKALGTPDDDPRTGEAVPPSAWESAVTPYLHAVLDKALKEENHIVVEAFIEHTLKSSSRFLPGDFGAKIFNHAKNLLETDPDSSHLFSLLKHAEYMTNEQIRETIAITVRIKEAQTFEKLELADWPHRPLSLFFEFVRTAEKMKWRNPLKSVFGKEIGYHGVKHHIPVDVLLLGVKVGFDTRTFEILDSLLDWQFKDRTPELLARHQLAFQYFTERFLKLGVSKDPEERTFYKTIEPAVRHAIEIADETSKTPTRNKKRLQLMNLLTRHGTAEGRLRIYLEHFREIETSIKNRLERLEAKLKKDPSYCSSLLIKRAGS